MKRTSPVQYWLTRVVFLRGLAAIYAIAFVVTAMQFAPLAGERGLLPASLFLKQTAFRYGGQFAGFLQAPSLFWLSTSDHFAAFLAWGGFALSCAALFGALSSVVYLLMWLFYLSFVNVGQVFYGFGWESMMLETGFLSIFLCNSAGTDPFSEAAPPPVIVIWFLRWMLFRVMFGAGLIKLRGDGCWLDLSCLEYHFETQPVPNPLSWTFHHLPVSVQRGGVVFNHFVELGVPWGYFGPRTLRQTAGLITIVFQLTLIASGNLSWLNYLTIVIAFSCFDDSAWGFLFSEKRLKQVRALPARLAKKSMSVPARTRRVALISLTVLIVCFSIRPALNLFSSSQVMNASFDPLHLVNTYGAFGSVSKTRNEVILSGTTDKVITPDTKWVEYEFKCKPGDVRRRPCLMSPYHYRIDWQMWFAAMSDYRYNDWMVHMVYKLLQGDQATLSLLDGDPFHGQRPTFIKADLYQYHFTDDRSQGWWKRSFEVPYLPPLNVENESLRNFIRNNGWDL